MADIELIIKISEDDLKSVENKIFTVEEMFETTQGRVYSAIVKGTPLPDIEKMLSNLDLSMSYVLESDHRSFANPVTGNSWLFDKIIDWRKTIQPYIKKES